MAAVPGVMLGTYMAAFAADDPSASTDAVWNFMVTVWLIGLAYVVLLITGVVGGWIAYRKRRLRPVLRPEPADSRAHLPDHRRGGDCHRRERRLDRQPVTAGKQATDVRGVAACRS